MILPVKNVLSFMPKDLLLHSKRVALLGFLLAKQMGFTKQNTLNITLGGLLHDIGKCYISPNILYKKSKLSEREFIEVKKHCKLGVNALNKYPNIGHILPIVMYHHERWDGFGYEGLKGTEIPIEARIISIADAFDAMTSPRPYQRLKSKKEAMKELCKCAETQFDYTLVREFNFIINRSSCYTHVANFIEFIE